MYRWEIEAAKLPLALWKALTDVFCAYRMNQINGQPKNNKDPNMKCTLVAKMVGSGLPESTNRKLLEDLVKGEKTWKEVIEVFNSRNVSYMIPTKIRSICT